MSMSPLPRPAGPQPRDGLPRARLFISAPRPAGPQPRDGLPRARLFMSAPRPAGPQPRDGLPRALQRAEFGVLDAGQIELPGGEPLAHLRDRSAQDAPLLRRR